MARVLPLKKTLSDEELANYSNKLVTLEHLKKQARQLEAELKAEEQGFLARLKAGSRVAAGWVATIQEKAGQVRPSWKEEFEALALRVGLNPGEEVGKVIAGFTPETKEILVVVKK